MITTQPTSNATKLSDAIAHVESSFGKRMTSRTSGARGWHHMTPAAWEDVNKSRKARNLPLHSFSNCMDYEVSSLYCNEYLRLIYVRLAAHPTCGTQEKALAAYNGGFTKLKALNFDTSHFKAYINAVNKHLK